MKYFLCSFFFATMALCVNAQITGGNSITGTLINADTKLPLEYGTITLFKKGDTKPITGTTSNKTGAFNLADIPAGTYILVLENLGFIPDTMNMPLNKKDAIIDLKTISLKSQKNLLQTVTIVSNNNLIENKIDKIVFNAEKDISSQGGVATDILKKIPQVSVDAEGNVQLSGVSGIRFLVNGKPSTAFGSNIADVLQSIPASQIKSVEVITNPGAKYDAQGMGGIINIILKSNNSQGYNGNISLSAGTRTENGSFNFNARKNDLAAHAFLSGNKRLKASIINHSYRETSNGNITSTLQQVAANHFEREGFQTGAGIDWTYKKNNSFSGNFSYNYFGNNGYGYSNDELLPDKTDAASVVNSLVNAASSFKLHNLEYSLEYKRTFKKEDQELEIAMNSSTGNNKIKGNTEQLLLPQDSVYYGTKSYNPAKEQETEWTIDYSQPLGEDIKLGIGGKAVFYDTKSNSGVTSYNGAIKNYQPDASLSNNLDYKQQVYAGYAEISFPVAKLFEAKIGGRFERTEINAFFSNAQQQVNIPGYNTVVPSVFLSKKIKDKNTFKLSYSKRIERPDYEELNPYVNTTDPNNLSTGNPYLQPEIGHRFELGYSRDMGKTGSLMVNLFYRINDNDIQPFIKYYPVYQVSDTSYNNVAVSRRENIGRENNMGMNLFGDIHFTAKLNVRGNLFLFYRHTINTIDKGYNSNSFNYRFNINTSYQFTNSLLAEFFANFNAARHEAQGRYPSFTSYTLAIRKQFWQKKGSIALTATNFFSENILLKTVLSGPNFTVHGERQFPIRSIGLNVTWKFGKLEFKKNTEEGDNNMNAPAQ